MAREALRTIVDDIQADPVAYLLGLSSGDLSDLADLAEAAADDADAAEAAVVDLTADLNDETTAREAAEADRDAWRQRHTMLQGEQLSGPLVRRVRIPHRRRG